ncbi:hypothetical protein GVAV_000375 [Gurleya vavrai]
MLLNFVFAMCKIISDDPIFSSYKEYCGSTYQRFPGKENYKLNKLIVFFRHGDRAAQEISNTNWKDKKCIYTDVIDNNILDLTVSPCTKGALTLKGYKQMIDLGIFIKENYGYYDENEIFKQCTSVQRTQSSLHGVMYGINEIQKVSQIEIYKIRKDELRDIENCNDLNLVVKNMIMKHFNKIKYKDVKSKEENFLNLSDKYLSCFCNNLPINCNNENCENEIIRDYIEKSFNFWDDFGKLIRTDYKTAKMTFGRYCKQIIDIIYNNKKLSLISSHDIVLIMILAGIGVKNIKQPGYASAIFLEIGEHKDNCYIRIIYNNKIVKTVFDVVYIPCNEFLLYLNEYIYKSDSSCYIKIK